MEYFSQKSHWYIGEHESTHLIWYLWGRSFISHGKLAIPCAVWEYRLDGQSWYSDCILPMVRCLGKEGVLQKKCSQSVSFGYCVVSPSMTMLKSDRILPGELGIWGHMLRPKPEVGVEGLGQYYSFTWVVLVRKPKPTVTFRASIGLAILPSSTDR
jgi:hypothetical protein